MIKIIEGANHYLRETYLDKINDKFEKAAKSSEDKHRSIKSYGDLSQIFCWEYERNLSNDFIIRFKNRFFQLEKNQAIHLRPKNKLQVRIHLDNQISLWYEKTQLTYRELEEAPVKKDVEKVKKVYPSSTRSVNARENKSKTPWSKFDSNWLKKKRSTESIQVNVS